MSRLEKNCKKTKKGLDKSPFAWYNEYIKRKKEVNQMSTHDGLVLLAIYVGVIGAGALIEYVEHRVKRAIRRRKRS